MLCRDPYMIGSQAFPCGGCLPCLFNRRRLWTHRIMLEASLYKDNSFLTLTYDDEHLPVDGSLVKKHLQDFMKRFRKSIEPIKVRYYGVGEYGERTQRPHYHLALFGWPGCLAGNTLTASIEGKRSCCAPCARVQEAWLLGGIMLGTLRTESAQYIAGYVTKKMTNKNHAAAANWLGRRDPEFSVMSRRPGIGVDAMHEVASSLMQFNLDTSESDVPVTLRHGSRQFPLGRHLRGKLREYIGKDSRPSKAVQIKNSQRLLYLLEAASKDKENPSFKKKVIEAGDQKVRQQEALRAIHKKEKKL